MHGFVVRDAVVLAAGASRRMGSPKGLLPVAGATLLEAHVAAFEAAGLRTTVVLGCNAEALRARLPASVRVVINPDWAATGPAESAYLALSGLGAALLTPVDVPPASPADLRALLDAGGPAVLAFDGRDGHPIRLDPPHLPVRLDARTAGARRLAVGDPDRIVNLNTPTEWNAWINQASKT